MTDERQISKAVISRLPRYYRYLGELMEEGIDLLITGGDKSHIGAVEIANPDGELFCVNFPTHKDDVIAGKWCRELWNRYKVQTVVSVGIHYDAATRELIKEILNETDKMMEELLNG